MSGMNTFPKINSNDWTLIRHIAWQNLIIVNKENHALGSADFEWDKIGVP